MTDITVEAANFEHLTTLRSVLETAIRSPVDGTIYHDEIDEVLASVEASIRGESDRQYLVAVAAGRGTVGLMGICPLLVNNPMYDFARTSKPAELINAYTDTSVRRLGVGSALLAGIETLAREAKYRELILNSGPRFRETGWPFWHDKFGPEVGGLLNRYGRGNHAPVWHKLLVGEV